jgi:hypothetical protein
LVGKPIDSVHMNQIDTRQSPPQSQRERVATRTDASQANGRRLAVVEPASEGDHTHGVAARSKGLRQTADHRFQTTQRWRSHPTKLDDPQWPWIHA